MNAALRVFQGAQYLDKTNPLWHKRIDITRLAMSSGKGDILGQLYGDFFTGCKALLLSTQHAYQLGYCISPIGATILVGVFCLSIIASMAILISSIFVSVDFMYLFYSSISGLIATAHYISAYSTLRSYWILEIDTRNLQDQYINNFLDRTVQLPASLRTG